MELVERIEKDYRDASKDQYIPSSSSQSLHMDYDMYILSAIDRSWENLILRNLKEKTTTNVATDIFDEFGSGENQRLMKSEKELLDRMGKEQYIPCLEYSSPRSSSTGI